MLHADDRTTEPPRTPRRGAVAASYFLLFMGAGIYLPYFPLYLDMLGFSGREIGAVVGMQPILRHLSSIAFGWTADRWRMRHRLAVLLAIVAVAWFVPLLWVRSLLPMLVVMAGISIVHGPLIAAIDATVMDHLASLGGDYGRLRLWGSLAFIAGAGASATAVHIWSPAVIPALFLLPAALLPIALARLPSAQAPSHATAGPPWTLLSPPLAAFLAAVLLTHLSSGAWGGFFAIYTGRLGMPAWSPGLAWALAVAAEVVLFRWGHRVLAVVSPARLVLLAVVVTVVRWGATAAVSAPALVVLLQVGHAFTFSAFHLAAMLLLVRLVPPERSTSGQALYGFTGFGLGGSSGLWLAGMLLEPLGTRGLFAFEAGVAAVALVPAWVLTRRVRD